MYHPNRILERELEFTKIYRENIGQPKAVRESRCMDAQMATYFVTIQPQDLIARKDQPGPYVVFATVYGGRRHRQDRLLYRCGKLARRS